MAKQKADLTEMPLTELVGELSGKLSKTARKQLRKRSAEERIPALIQSLSSVRERKAFERIAELLAESGDEAAFTALAAQARTHPRFPAPAIHALAACDHPNVVPVLLDLLEYGRPKQQRTAAYELVRLKAGRAVLPLCRGFGSGNGRLEAWEILQRMGSPDQIARIVLADALLDVSAQVTTLLALEQVVTLAHPASLLRGWGLFRFQAERFLIRESADTRSPVCLQARAASERLRAQKTLLRPSTGEASEQGATLLRPASGVGDAHGEHLLRAAYPTENASEPSSDAAGRGLMHWFRRTFRIRS